MGRHFTWCTICFKHRPQRYENSVKLLCMGSILSFKFQGLLQNFGRRDVTVSIRCKGNIRILI